MNALNDPRIRELLKRYDGGDKNAEIIIKRITGKTPKQLRLTQRMFGQSRPLKPKRRRK